MKTRVSTSFAAALGLSGMLIAPSAMAATFTVISNQNGPLGAVGADTSQYGLPVDTHIAVSTGDTVTISTSPTNYWAFNNDGFIGTSLNPTDYMNATGFDGSGTSWNDDHGHTVYATGPAGINSGALAWSLDGADWGAGYLYGSGWGTADSQNATTTTFTAAGSGDLLLAMWDSYLPDNIDGNGHEFGTDMLVDVTVTSSERAVPEPGSIAVICVGLMGLGALHRRQPRR